MQATLARVSWCILGALLFFGLFQEQLFSQSTWSAAGGFRFGAYLGGSALLLGSIVWRWPEQVLRVAAGAALGWTVWWAGPVAPLAVLFFLGSCFALGRMVARGADGMLAVLVGAALWMTVLWVALHFPVNFLWVYGIAFAVPYAFVRPPWRIPRMEGRRQAWGAALLVLLLGAQLLAALKPEVSSDGLGIHLVLPDTVARTGVWTFDHRRDVWALMPAGADALFTGVYLLGGEPAAKLLNFAFLVLTAGLLVSEGRRWTSEARAWLGAALFVSTPLVLLVTGSLFVENVWAAFLLGAVIALARGNVAISGVLAGAAVAVKLIAAAFAGPLTIAALVLVGARSWRFVVLAGLLAGPPYAFAFVKSGNPVFPFANTWFRSPDYDTVEDFKDARYEGLALTPATPFEMTFRSARYLEGGGGAAGFQYFWLLVPGLLLTKRREQWVFAAVGLAGAAIVLAAVPNLRYLYGALPLISLAVSCAPWTLAYGVSLALNLWFQPAAGYYDREFALFRKSDVPAYLAANGPSVPLIELLNREHRGEPVAFFSDGAVARLEGRAYTDSWHHEAYWKRVREMVTPAEIAGMMRGLGIRHVVAPTQRRAQFDVVQRFQELWLDPEPEGTVGRLTLYHLRAAERPVRRDQTPLGPGTYDDREPRIEYSGRWFRDNQFAQAVEGTLSYSDAAGASLRFPFEGSAVTLVFTRAENRGIAEVRVDGTAVGEIRMHARPTQWSSRETVRIAPGVHTLEIVVTGRRDANSVGTFVDLDAVEIR